MSVVALSDELIQWEQMTIRPLNGRNTQQVMVFKLVVANQKCSRAQQQNPGGGGRHPTMAKNWLWWTKKGSRVHQHHDGGGGSIEPWQTPHETKTTPMGVISLQLKTPSNHWNQAHDCRILGPRMTTLMSKQAKLWHHKGWGIGDNDEYGQQRLMIGNRWGTIRENRDLVGGWGEEGSEGAPWHQ